MVWAFGDVWSLGIFVLVGGMALDVLLPIPQSRFAGTGAGCWSIDACGATQNSDTVTKSKKFPWIYQGKQDMAYGKALERLISRDGMRAPQFEIGRCCRETTSLRFGAWLWMQKYIHDMSQRRLKSNCAVHPIGNRPCSRIPSMHPSLQRGSHILRPLTTNDSQSSHLSSTLDCPLLKSPAALSHPYPPLMEVQMSILDSATQFDWRSRSRSSPGMRRTWPRKRTLRLRSWDHRHRIYRHITAIIIGAWRWLGHFGARLALMCIILGEGAHVLV